MDLTCEVNVATLLPFDPLFFCIILHSDGGICCNAAFRELSSKHEGELDSTVGIKLGDYSPEIASVWGLKITLSMLLFSLKMTITISTKSLGYVQSMSILAFPSLNPSVYRSSCNGMAFCYRIFLVH